MKPLRLARHRVRERVEVRVLALSRTELPLSGTALTRTTGLIVCASLLAE